MINNLGKWFYVSDIGEGAKPSTFKLLRVMQVHETHDGKVCCETETNIKLARSGENAIGPTVDKDYLLIHYTAISPQLVAYHVTFKDAPAFDSLYIVFEPYDLEDKQVVGEAISVYPTLSFQAELPSSHFTFTCHKRMDAVEYFRDMKGYKDYEAGPLAAIYYDDSCSTLLTLSLRNLCKKEPWKTTRTLLERRNSFAKLANVEIDPDMKSSGMLSLSHLSLALGCIHRSLLNLMPIKTEEAVALRKYVKERDLTKDNCLSALTRLLRFEAKSDSINEEDVIADKAFQQSLMFMPYDLSMDLDKIKSNNPMYTLVLANTGVETYVIMYRRAPVEFRSPNQTGFSPDEMSKLLR